MENEPEELVNVALLTAGGEVHHYLPKSEAERLHTEYTAYLSGKKELAALHIITEFYEAFLPCSAILEFKIWWKAEPPEESKRRPIRVV
jgi:hypothetical protein